MQQNIEFKTAYHLDKYSQQARDAYRNTSFDPEKRGEEMIREYSNELQTDIERLQGQRIPEETINDYQRKYESLFVNYLHAMAGTYSVMITGPANFNPSRHAKRTRSRERHYEIFREWRKRAVNAIIRKNQTPVNELEAARAKLAAEEKHLELMKKVNALIRKTKGNCLEELQQLGFTLEIATKLLNPIHSYFGKGYQTFELTNLRARMKHTAERVQELEKREQNATNENKVIPFNGGELIHNYEMDRVQIKTESKPDYKIRKIFKRHGFKWSPTQEVWQRQLTANGISTAVQLVRELFTQ